MYWPLGGVNEEVEMECANQDKWACGKVGREKNSHQGLAQESEFPLVHNCGRFGRKGVMRRASLTCQQSPCSL